MQPRALLLTDEGLSGLALHVVNDAPRALDARIGLALYRGFEVKVAEGAVSVDVPARGSREIRADAVLERFCDTTYAYRFGPPAHDVAVATLRAGGDDAVLSESFHFPLGFPGGRAPDPQLEARLDPRGAGFALTVRTSRFAEAVVIDAGEWLPEDNHFHLAPGRERVIALRAARPGAAPPARGTVSALNAHAKARIVPRN
jgi:beta-mannosidase